MRDDEAATRERWRHVEQLFAKAQGLRGEMRERFLSEASCGDAALREEVESLLASAARNEDFLETPVPGSRPDLEQAFAGARDPLIGQCLGPYVLTRRIAAGGMGTVYLARRADEEYEGEVAIKVVKRGMDTDEVLRRFALERQVLASLEHPCIARLIDAGSTPDGRPYYVMPYVDGRALTEACDAARMTLDARLRLFVRVCDAVQCAHRNLVLHRDLKPSNILLDASGKPVLLDFGIAKLLAPGELDLTSLHPEGKGRRMSPQYSSPEHAAGERTATASDVYSLGVLLYELVTGCLPYDTNAGEGSTTRERVIRATALRPSAAPIDEGIARARSTSVRRLRRRISGDLENVMLCAMRKEPERRYASASMLGADVERTLASLPVQARADSLRYRMQKFLGRHRGLVAAVLLVVACLSFALVSTTRSAERARLEARNAEHVTRLLVEIFSAIDPQTDKPLTLGPAKKITALELLDLGTERIRKKLHDMPWIRARLLHAFGQIYLNLGATRQAFAPLEEAVGLRSELGGADDVDVASTTVFLASAHLRIGEVDKGLPMLRRALRVLEPVLQAGDPLLDFARNSLASALSAKGQLDKAEQLFRAVLASRVQRFGAEHASVGDAKNNVALVTWRRGDDQGAKSLFEDALAHKRASLPADHPSIAMTLHNLGYLTLKNQGDAEGALPRLLKAQEIRKRRYPPFHASLAASAHLIAQCYMALDRSVEAEALVREAIAIYEKQAGKTSWFVAEARTLLGDCLRRCDRIEEARRELVPHAEALLRVLPSDHEHSQEVLERLVAFYETTGDEERAAKYRAMRRDATH